MHGSPHVFLKNIPHLLPAKKEVTIINPRTARKVNKKWARGTGNVRQHVCLVVKVARD